MRNKLYLTILLLVLQACPMDYGEQKLMVVNTSGQEIACFEEDVNHLSCFYNNPDSSTVFEDALPGTFIDDRVLDVKKLEDIADYSAPLNLNAELFSHIGYGFIHDYNFVGRIAMADSIDSVVILGKTDDNAEKCLFLMNLNQKRVTSVLVLSKDFYISSDHYSHTYSTIDKNVVTIYDNTVWIDDVYAEGEGERIPFFLRIKDKLLSIFARNQGKYKRAFRVELNSEGYLFHISPGFC